MNFQPIPLAALLAFLFAMPVQAAERGGFSLNAGVDYSTGKYGGAAATDIWYFPVTGKFETGPWLMKLTVPYLRISGPANVVGGDRVVTGAAAGTRTESGLGDVVGNASYAAWYDRDAAMGLDLGGKVKFATASSKRGLGTGKNDLAVYADLYKGLGNLSLFTTLGYKWLGDPAGFNLNDVWYGSLGGSYKLGSGKDSLGLAYDWREKTSAAGSHTSEMTAFWSRKLEGETKLQVYLVGGLSDGSPDLGLGANIGFGF